MFRSLGECVTGLDTPAQGTSAAAVIRPHLQKGGKEIQYSITEHMEGTRGRLQDHGTRRRSFSSRASPAWRENGTQEQLY